MEWTARDNLGRGYIELRLFGRVKIKKKKTSQIYATYQKIKSL